MPELIHLKSFNDKRGNLTVIEKILPFDIKRIFYIYGVDDSVRGGHRHHETIQAAICIHGECRITNNNGIETNEYHLDHPEKCLILYPEDWHTMHHFSSDAVLLVLASTVFNSEDYIYTPYSDSI